MDTLGEWPIFPETVRWEEAQTALEAQALGDGLPLVPPTARRLETMLADCAVPARSYGQLLPLFGDLTTAAVAYNCVLAGCGPAALPIVLTAAEACLEPSFNLLGLLTTTGTPAIATIVHGPATRALAMNAGTNCLGPGNGANATLGRAIALVMLNIGGARAGIGDMATMGQPGKYGFCFPEGNDRVFPPLPARRAIDGDISAVTVLGVSGTVEVLPGGAGNSPEAILEPMAAAMMAVPAAASAGRQRELGEQFFLLPPELAGKIAGHGWDLARLRAYLSATDAVARGPADIHPIVTGGPGVKMTYLPLWAGGTHSVTRAVRDLQD
jgi:hypothetical protein